MKKILVILIALICIAAGTVGIMVAGGKIETGRPKDDPGAVTGSKSAEQQPENDGQTNKTGGTEDVDIDGGISDKDGGAGADVSDNADAADKTTSETIDPNADEKPVDTTETTEDAVSELVDKTMAEMSLHDKVCQMMFVTPEGLTGTDNVTVAGDATKQALRDHPVGGIIYFAHNFESVDQTKEMIANTQSYSKTGLFIATDEEGGMVNRLMDTLGTTYIYSMYEYKNQGTDTAYENAKTIATDMAGLGFNLDFAPVADVWSNPDNTVIGERAYSDDYAQAAELVGSAVKGFKDGGVICTLKHFPGHGDTAEDSHYSSAYVNRTKTQIMADEMQPFRAGIDAGAELVMVGHLIVPDIDELPATLSYKIATEMLRGDMGFEGVAITDSMEMESIADNYGVADSAVMAVQAGMDMLLQPADLAAAVDAIVTAVQNGDITESRIDESVRRILTLKAQCGLLE